MNLFKSIRSGIQKAAQKVRSVFQRKKPKEKAKEDKLVEARMNAFEVMRYAAHNPSDKTAIEAAELAATFIERTTPEHNRIQENYYPQAERYLANKLSSVEGIEEAKANRLEAFNNNFGLSLSQDEWQTMDKLVGSSSFQKMLDVKSQFYDVMYQMVGDAVQQKYNPEKIKDVIDLYQTFDLEPEFSTFRNVLQMNNADYGAMKERMYDVPEDQRDEVDFNRVVESFQNERIYRR